MSNDSHLYWELVKIFPDDGRISCYPYTIIVDQTYEEHDVESLDKFIIERKGAGFFMSHVNYNYPNLIVHAIGNDDAYVITKHKFDIECFDKKYHDFINSRMQHNVMTLEEFKEKVVKNEVLRYTYRNQ